MALNGEVDMDQPEPEKDQDQPEKKKRLDRPSQGVKYFSMNYKYYLAIKL